MNVSGSARHQVAVPPEVTVLEPFVGSGVFGPFEVHLAATMARLVPGTSDDGILALALAARAPRHGHVYAELHHAADHIAGSDDRVEGVRGLPWPEADEWVRALTDSPLVSVPGGRPADRVRPLVLEGGRVYLQRFWHYELAVADELRRRAGRDPAAPDGAGSDPVALRLDAVLDLLFGPDDGPEPDLQRGAARKALTSGISVIAGGPGTGKTHTVARILAGAHLVAAADGLRLDVALAAPTGKAGIRIGDAVRGEVPALEGSGAVSPELAAQLMATEPITVDRLLGWLPGARFRHDARNPLPHHLVIIDETSMVSLPMMAKLLDAMRPDARLVLVGDPHQLASIEAGTVMDDVVGPAEDPGRAAGGPLAGRVTVLRRMRRFAEDSAIAALAAAVRAGEANTALELLGGGHSDLRWVRDDDGDGLDRVLDRLVTAGIEVGTAAMEGDARGALGAATRIKVLAATRGGPLGLYDWSDRIEAAVAEALPALNRSLRWYVGRPVIVTGNDAVNGVFNGDVGVVVAHDGEVRVDIVAGDGVRALAPSRLDRVDTWWAMTIHKSQGSEFSHAVVSLPRAASPILTRELLYTAVTRAKDRVTVVGSEASLRAAIDRPIARASGLRHRLWP